MLADVDDNLPVMADTARNLTDREPHWARRLVASAWTPVVIILVGMVLRLAYIAIKGPELYLAEASNVAVSIASGLGFADAYFPGSGPTAHLLPTTPLISGMIMKVFGIRTATSQTILIAFSLIQTALISTLLLKLFSHLKVSRIYVLSALTVSLVVPVTFSLDAYLFSCWDNGLAFIACLACLLDQVGFWTAGKDSFGRKLRSAAILAIAVFVNPLLGVALASCVFTVRLRRSGFWPAVLTGVLSLEIFAVIVAPWAWRNQQVLGSPILLRSNAGLELAIANHDAALSSRPADVVFNERNLAIHPFSDGPARAAFRKVGEPAYQNQLGQEARKWIMEHPAGFLQLCLRHMFRTLTPQGWQIGSFAGGRRALAMSFVCWTGLLALLWLIRRRRNEPWWIIGQFLAVALVAYAPFQPMARYIYPFYEIFLFTAFAGFGAWQADRFRKTMTARTSPQPGWSS